MLILRADMPRSIAASLGELTGLLDEVREQFGRNYRSAGLAHTIHDRIRFAKIDEVFEFGLHEFLTDIVDSNMAIGKAIAEDFGLPY